MRKRELEKSKKEEDLREIERGRERKSKRERMAEVERKRSKSLGTWLGGPQKKSKWDL